MGAAVASGRVGRERWRGQGWGSWRGQVVRKTVEKKKESGRPHRSSRRPKLWGGIYVPPTVYYYPRGGKRELCLYVDAVSGATLWRGPRWGGSHRRQDLGGSRGEERQGGVEPALLWAPAGAVPSVPTHASKRDQKGSVAKVLLACVGAEGKGDGRGWVVVQDCGDLWVQNLT